MTVRRQPDPFYGYITLARICKACTGKRYVLDPKTVDKRLQAAGKD
jgi:hypothetical protein